MAGIDFKGFGDWVEIFRGGKVIDSAGNEHDGDELIDKAIETFNPEIHEPPLVLGHPDDDAPAYGWVESLKKEGSLLFAKFKQVSNGLEDAIREGYFKKRSASFYPDGKLRHVGFLGAVPPAIKGLADLKFNVGKEKLFNFEEGIIMPETSVEVQTSTAPPDSAGMVGGGLLEWLASIFKAGEISGASKAAPLAPAMAETPSAVTTLAEEKPLTKDDVVAIVKELMSADLAEKKTDGDAPPAEDQAETDEEKKKKMIAEEKAGLEKQFAEKEATLRAEYAKKENDRFLADMKEKGQIIPAWEKLGLAAFMEKLSAETASFDFAEGVKDTPSDWFKKFLSEIPKTVDFTEIAKRSTEAATGGSSEKLETLTKKRVAEKNVSYAVAFAEVSKENPELVTEYMQEV